MLDLSRQLTSSILYGSQDVEAYFIVGRTMDLYVVSRTCLLQTLKLRLRNPSLGVIKLEFILKLKIKRNDWLLADTWYPGSGVVLDCIDS